MDSSTRDPYLIVPGHDAARKHLHDLLTAAPQDLTHDDMPLPEKPVFPRVQEIRVPTLVLIGAGDIADNLSRCGRTRDVYSRGCSRGCARRGAPDVP